MIRGNLEGNMQLLLCGKHSKMMMMLRRRRMSDNLYFVALQYQHFYTLGPAPSFIRPFHLLVWISLDIIPDFLGTECN